MPTALQWRHFWTITYTGNSPKNAVLIPISTVAEWVRIDILILTLPKPKWYLAGWVNQAYMVNGKPFLMPSTEVPLLPSVYKMPVDASYQLRFKPVPYLPSSLVRIYRSV